MAVKTQIYDRYLARSFTVTVAWEDSLERFDPPPPFPPYRTAAAVPIEAVGAERQRAVVAGARVHQHLQQCPLLGVHEKGFRLRHAKEGAVEDVRRFHETAQERKALGVLVHRIGVTLTPTTHMFYAM